MAIIPAHFAQEQIETSRLPRAPAGQLADTGQGIEALGLSGFGRALADVSSDLLQNIINVRSESQYLEGTSQWERAHTEFFTGLARDQDFENYGVKYKAFAKSLRRQIIKKGLTTPARRELEEYMERQQVSKEKQMAGLFLAKQRDYGRVSAFESVIKFEQAGDFAGAISAINRARNIGFMSAEEAHIRKQKIQPNIVEYQHQVFLNGLHESAKAKPYEEAIQDLNDVKGITSAERNDLIARRKRQEGLEQELRDQQINTEQGRLMGLARSSQLTDGIIRESILDEFGSGSKATFYSILDAQAAAALEKKVQPFKESNPEVEARILDRIRDPLSEITEKDISDLVGKGLSIDDASRMITQLDFFKSPWFTRADRYLKNQLGWSAEADKFLHPEGALSYHLAMNELFDALETEKLKGRDVLDRAAEISIPYLTDYWENVLMLSSEKRERLGKMLGIKPEPKRKPGKPKKVETKIEKKLDEIWK